MELKKLVVALSIAIFLTMFITEFLGVVYTGTSGVNYSRNVALIYGILGIAVLIIGFLFLYLESIGTGLILGATYMVAMFGVLSLFGVNSSLMGMLGGGASSAASWISVVVKGIMLALLIVLGYKYVDNED